MIAATPKTGRPRRGPRSKKTSDEQILAAVIASNGSYQEAAKALGISRQNVSVRVNQKPDFFHSAPKPKNGRTVARGSRLQVREKKKGVSDYLRNDSAAVAPKLRPRPEYIPAPAGPEELAELWKKYCSDRDNEGLRNAIAEYYLPFVTYQAERMQKRLPEGIEVGDLVSAGSIGLMTAIGGYDPDRGLKFETYAVQRVRGQMIDYLREIDWVPRLVRARNSRITKAAEKLTREFGRKPEISELAAELNTSVRSLEKEIADNIPVGSISLNKKWFESDNFKAISQADLLEDKRASDPTRRLCDTNHLRKLTRGLNKAERLIIIGYYWEGDTMKEIGRQLDLSETRVSQMHAAIIERMRRQLGAENAIGR